MPCNFPLGGRRAACVRCDVEIIRLCLSVCVCARACEDTFRRGCFKEVRQKALPGDSLPSTPPPTGEGNNL